MSSRSGAFGPAPTHILSSSSFPQHDRYHEESHSRPASSSAAAVQDRSPRGPRSPPSPPAIATLPGTGEEASDIKFGAASRNGGGGDHGARHASAADHRPSPVNGHSHRSRTSGGDSAPAPVDSNGPPHKRSPPTAAGARKQQSLTTPPVDADADADADPDADADADAEAEADVDDADLELLEAVDAAEANSSSAEPRAKTEEDDADDLAPA